MGLKSPHADGVYSIVTDLATSLYFLAALCFAAVPSLLGALPEKGHYFRYSFYTKTHLLDYFLP
jgi:hypothetical protein